MTHQTAKSNRQTPLSGQEWNIVMAISRRTSGNNAELSVTIAQIQEDTCISTFFIFSMINELAASGHITVTRDENDYPVSAQLA